MQPNRALGSSNWRTRDSGARDQRNENDEGTRTALREKISRDNEMRRRRKERSRDAAERRRPVGDGRVGQGQGEGEGEDEGATRIYVGNMPYSAQKRDVEEVFEREGVKIINIDISIDPFTHRNPSYCFVDLATPAAATTAMHLLPGTLLLGRPLKVKPCVQKRAPFPTSNAYQPYSASLQATRWKSSNADAAVPSTSAPASAPTDSHDPTASISSSTNPDPDPPSTTAHRVLVSNLPRPLDQHSSDLEIRALFREVGVRVERVSKVKRPAEVRFEKGNQWFAFVDLAGRGDVERAVERLDGVERWGGVLRVGVARGNGSGSG
ncbi:RNA-binding domain-containing protein [Byssothecium circinans]|uniref:RNA-binding domain-containing protein n=1 Tax=Byssothecium circinans TaxID=147558 RepID=A0A6A5U2D0_9PLEO|nr:RNA-binding domain-containing protein [Byssothecium circinans]